MQFNKTNHSNPVSAYMERSGAAVAGTTLAVSLSTKLLGGFGAVIGVADAIYSWPTNPNRASAEGLLRKVKENLKSLEEMKARFEQLQKI